MTTRTIRNLACATLAMVIAASGATAFAGPEQKTLAPAPVIVRYKDLNLSNEEGARVLYGRISNAARKACGPSFAVWYPTVSRQWKECYQATVDHAIKTVNQPMLTALYERSMKVAAR